MGMQSSLCGQNSGNSGIAGKRVLITGIGGFIAGHLCRFLGAQGAEIHGTFRKSRPDPKSVLSSVQCDLSDAEGIRAVLADIKPDIIFHLASVVHGSRDRESVQAMLRSNLVGTVNLLCAATDIGCQRIVLTGSLEEPDSGTAEAVPCSPYAASKWAGSSYARMFHALYGTPVTIARLFMVYGPGQQDVKKLIPYVILSRLRGQSPGISSGDRRVDWIYVEDVIEGLITMAIAPGICGRTLDLGSGLLISVREVVSRLCALLPADSQPQFGAIEERPMEQVRVANVNETFSRIEWKPRVDLEKGLRLTIDWYRDRLALSDGRAREEL
jgi:UDP-glucose 4-epimerase